MYNRHMGCLVIRRAKQRRALWKKESRPVTKEKKISLGPLDTEGMSD